MLLIRVIPCLLLSGRGLVKTVRFQNPSYVGDPINAVKIFNEKEVDELIFLAIDAARNNTGPRLSNISQIADECFMPLCYGGGIRSMEVIRELFSIGVEKVAINSYAVENPSFIKEASLDFGSQSIIVAMDVCRNTKGRHELYTHGGTKLAKVDPVEQAVKMQQMGCGELFINSIDRDGTMSGYDIDIIRNISEAVSIPVIACGGAGKLEDFVKAVKEGGASAVAAGSLFVFQGKHKAVLLTYPEAQQIEQLMK